MARVVVVVFDFGAKLYHFHISPSFSSEFILAEYCTVEIRLSIFISTVIDFNVCVCECLSAMRAVNTIIAL